VRQADAMHRVPVIVLFGEGPRARLLPEKEGRVVGLQDVRQLQLYDQ